MTCKINMVSSRVCKKGTKGCDNLHISDSPRTGSYITLSEENCSVELDDCEGCLLCPGVSESSLNVLLSAINQLIQIDDESLVATECLANVKIKWNEACNNVIIAGRKHQEQENR